jgi:hypothetical protein
MTKRLMLCAILICTLRSVAMGSEIGDLKWNRANINRLRSFSKTEVLRFLNPELGKRVTPVKSTDWLDFGWFDLAGDGKYELVTASSFGPCCLFADVYEQDAAGNVRQQSLKGAMGAGNLNDILRDLDGDGKADLVLGQGLAEPHTWIPVVATPQWPAVYRLENGRYVEASHDFPTFYDKDILPKIDSDIREAKTNNLDKAAILTLEKDKILRVLGRDPTAGLKQAYEWMNSGDSQMLQCAVATFRDIGGHDKEMREAEQAMPEAFKHERESRGGKS